MDLTHIVSFVANELAIATVVLSLGHSELQRSKVRVVDLRSIFNKSQRSVRNWLALTQIFLPTGTKNPHTFYYTEQTLGHGCN